MRIKIVLLSVMLVCTSAVVCWAGDTLLPFNSLRLEFAGKAFGLVGLTFEHAWQKQSPQHPRAFNSVEANISYVGFEFMMTSIGANRNWHLGEQKKWTINCGLAIGSRICLNPTSKEMRDYYDSTQIYSGEYLTPLQLWFFGNVSCRYTFRRVFVQASFVPVLFYEKASRAGWTYGPWGGVSVGLRFK